MLNLKTLRTDKKISQQKLANDIGVSRSTIAMWETGGSQPDNDNLKELAKYFNVSVDYLLGREEQTPTLDKQLEGIEYALYGELHDLTDSEKEDILSYVKFKKSQRGE
jgi:repressor LexA